MEIKLEAVDNSLSDINYFKYEELDDKTVAIKLAHSLEDLVDRVSEGLKKNGDEKLTKRKENN